MVSSSSPEIYRLVSSKRRNGADVSSFFDYISPSVSNENESPDRLLRIFFTVRGNFKISRAMFNTVLSSTRLEANYNILHRSFSVHRKIINLHLFFSFQKGEKKLSISPSARGQRIWLSEPTHVIEREGFVARCCRYAAAGYRNISLASPSCVGHWPLGVSECLNTDYRIVPFTRVSARLHVRLQLSYDFPYNHRKGIFLASKFLSLNRSTSFPQ